MPPAICAALASSVLGSACQRNGNRPSAQAGHADMSSSAPASHGQRTERPASTSVPAAISTPHHDAMAANGKPGAGAPIPEAI